MFKVPCLTEGNCKVNTLNAVYFFHVTLCKAFIVFKDNYFFHLSKMFAYEEIKDEYYIEYSICCHNYSKDLLKPLFQYIILYYKCLLTQLSFILQPLSWKISMHAISENLNIQVAIFYEEKIINVLIYF